MFHLLFVTGLCLFTQSISCQYVLIQQQKTWDEALAYCRQNHIDLATVQSNDEWIYVQDAVQPSLTSIAWIGMYNDINSWRWSYKEENPTVTFWLAGEPNNRDESCAVMEGGRWADYPCNYQLKFSCYNENGANRYVYVTHVLGTWSYAQSYCRQHYTDLAIIRSQTENNQLANKYGWIGLFRDLWKWSNGTDVSLPSINWKTGQPDIDGLNRPCGAISPDGQIDDRFCSDVLPFTCLTYSKKQIVRLKVKSGQNLNDPAVMENILQLIKLKLKDHGMEKDTRLKWRVQPDGNVFSQI